MSLRQHLDQGAGLDAEYGHNLASHLPMALTALARLGAPTSGWPRLQTTTRAPAPCAAARALACRRAWQPHSAIRRLADVPQSVQRVDGSEGAPAVLEQTLPALMQGVGAAAFHGPIRAAYAVAAGHSHELADALAYWACRWFCARLAVAQRQRGEPGDRARRTEHRQAAPPLIAERMALAAEHPAFGRVASGLRIDPDRTLAQLATLAARLYATSANFTVLHLVTSAHAMRVLLPWLDDGDRVRALGHYWLAYAAGHAASGVADSAAAGAPRGTPRPWPDIVALAMASDDDHVIKLVDSCREQERAYGGAVWREAASRAVANA